jgi:hypothetical protein
VSCVDTLPRSRPTFMCGQRDAANLRAVLWPVRFSGKLGVSIANDAPSVTPQGVGRRARRTGHSE